MSNILQNALKYLSDSLLPSNNFSFDYRKPHAQEATPAAQIQSPQPSPAIQNAQQLGEGFKYQMGQHDYSNIKPQVQAVLKGTPLEQYADNFIEAGNKHGVDPRVLITIANNESSMGRQYDPSSFNPFGYIVDHPDYGNATGKAKSDLIQTGLKNAGFTSLPMAIDRMTQRFSDHPFNPTGQNYATFRQDPTISNLQTAYNANDEERANYLKNAQALVQQFR